MENQRNKFLSQVILFMRLTSQDLSIAEQSALKEQDKYDRILETSHSTKLHAIIFVSSPFP